MTDSTTYYPVQFPQGPLAFNGAMSIEWQRFFLSLWNRTGSGDGLSSGQALKVASDALAAANEALSKSASASDGSDQAIIIASSLQSIVGEAIKIARQASDVALMSILQAEMALARSQMAEKSASMSNSMAEDLAVMRAMESAAMPPIIKRIAENWG